MIKGWGLLLAAVVAMTPTTSGDDDAAAPHVPAAMMRAAVLIADMQESLSGRDVGDEWPYEGVYRVGGQIPIGYRIGGTALCSLALLHSPAYAASAEVATAVERGLGFILDHLGDDLMSAGFRGTYDVRGWGQIYALTFLLEARATEEVPKSRRADVDNAITRLVAALQVTAIPKVGGWAYSRRKGYDEPNPASPFMTAPALLALFEAARQGEDVDRDTVELALGALVSSRTASGAVPYDSSGSDERWPGAIGRTPAVETALLLGGRGHPDQIATALDAFFEHWSWLEQRRRQNGTHKAPYGVAPYYFFYAHYYAALAIEMLPAEGREGYRRQLLARLFEVQEESGGWNDRVFERSENFGTAMSLMALGAPGQRSPARWIPAPAANTDALPADDAPANESGTDGR